MSDTTSFSVGDVVRVKAEYARAGHIGQTYTVVKRNPRTLGLTNTTTGRKMNADPECLILADAPDPTPTHTVAGAPFDTLGGVTIEAPVPVGSVVKATRLRGQSPDALYVVTAHVSDRRTYSVNHRLSPLGGNVTGTYWTGIPKKHLTVLSLEDVAAAILDTL